MNQQFLRLAWPMILSGITVPLLGLIDTAILGHLPEIHYLGAVAVGSVVFDMLFWAFAFLRMGVTGLAAQAWGAQDYQRVRLLLGQYMVLALAFGIVLILLKRPLFDLALAYMAPAPDVVEQARIYCDIRILAAPPSLANYAIMGWLLSASKVRVLLAMAVAANLLNAGLDYLLVMHWGLRADGVAWGSVITEYSLLGIGCWNVYVMLHRTPGRFIFSSLLRLGDYRSLISVNRAIFVRTLCLLFAISFFYSQSARQDEVTLAANAVMMTVILVFAYGQDGFANAAEVLVGRSLGAARLQAFHIASRICLRWSLLTAVLFTLFLLLFDHWVFARLTDHASVVSAALNYRYWLLVFPLLACWNFAYDGIFIGATKTEAMQYCMAFSAFAVFAPVWFVTQGLGNHGLWLAFCAFHLARSLSMAWTYRYYDRHRGWLQNGVAKGEMECA